MAINHLEGQNANDGSNNLYQEIELDGYVQGA